ncbi:HAD-IIIA family hydrolase [Sporolactobacillus sp. THM7-4]|nr:HAD-IIIA family hydrolase [Sporolactobacillus sp. THM7-4]
MFMLKTIIFDFDGTLVDSKEVLISTYNQLAERHHYKKFHIEELDRFMKLPLKEQCRSMQIPFHKIPQIIFELLKGYKSSLKKIRFIEGINELLYTLKKSGYELAIISSNAEKNIQQFLSANDVHYFSTVMCSGDVYRKDRMINKFLKKNHLRTSQVIYVGDEARDIIAGKKSGVKVIWAAWGFDSFEIVKRAKPDFIAKKPNEIIDIVEAI